MSHPLDAALAGSDATNADGATTIKTYADVVASTVVATATLNNANFIYPLIQLVVTGTSGGWSNIQVGQDVWVGSAAGLNDIGIYRIRATNASYLLIGEAGPGDGGLVTIGLRTTTFTAGQYITVINRYSPWSVLPLISQGVIYEDYGVLVTDSPANWNSHPPPLVQVKCTSTNRTEYNHIACFVDDGQTYATITFLASVTLWPTSASATYAWSGDTSTWTVTAGSVATATFTAQVPSRAANYVLDLAVTENGGNIAKRHVMVWVHDRSGSKAPLTVSGLSGDGWDRTGAKLNFTLNDNLLASYPDGAMVCIWQEATFNGATIATAVDQFVGWIVRIGKTSEVGLRTAEPQFVGPAGILDFKRGTSQLFDVTAGTPANWQQLPASLMSLSFAQFWLFSQRARGILELFDFTPYSTDATGQRLPEINVPPGQLWAQQVNLADGIMKRNIGCDPDGSIWVQPHPSLVAYASRSSIVKRDTLTASRYYSVDWPREMFDRVGLVEGEAFSWDGSATLPTPLLSLALSTSLGQGGSDQKLQNQLVATQADLNTLTGLYYRYLNPDYPDITFNFHGNRGALYKPAQMQMVRGQIPQGLTPEDVAFDRYTIPKEVRRSYITTEIGSVVVDSSLICEVETAGVDGTTKAVPSANQTLYGNVTVITSPEPQTGIGNATHDGGTVIVLDRDNLGITVNWFGTTPIWTKITAPTSVGHMYCLILDPFSGFLTGGANVLGAWLLTATGLYYTGNILSTTPSWALKNALSPGVTGGVIRASITSQGVIYAAYVHESAEGNFDSYVYTKKLSNYGTTQDWTNTLGSTGGSSNGNVGVGMDIDSYGSDEMLVGVRDGGAANKASIFRILNGTPTEIINLGAVANNWCGFIQKPLKTAAGANNSNTSTTESFIYTYQNNGTPKIKYTDDGGSTSTDISTGGASLYDTGSSIVATDSQNYIAVIDSNGSTGLYTSTNRGVGWTSRGGDATNTKYTIGYYPGLISGSHALYMGGTSKLAFSPDFGVTLQDKTGNWTTAVGAIAGFFSVIPLY